MLSPEFLTGVVLGVALALLGSACRRRRHSRPAVRWSVNLQLMSQSTGSTKEIIMATTVPPGFNVRITLTPLDADGQPTTVDLQDREIGWTSSVPDVTVTPDPGGLSAVAVAPQGFRGTAQIQANADADLDAAEDRPIIMLADLEYVGGEAQVLQGSVTLEPKV